MHDIALPFFDIHEQSWHNTFVHGEPTHRLDKLESSQRGGASMFPLFVVLACLAVVSSDDYQTHRHSSHDAVCLTDFCLPAGKVKSGQDQRRWMPLCTAPIVDFTGGKKSTSLWWIFLWLCLISASAYWHIPKTPTFLFNFKFFLLLMLIHTPVFDHHWSVLLSWVVCHFNVKWARCCLEIETHHLFFSLFY